MPTQMSELLSNLYMIPWRHMEGNLVFTSLKEELAYGCRDDCVKKTIIRGLQNILDMRLSQYSISRSGLPSSRRNKYIL